MREGFWGNPGNKMELDKSKRWNYGGLARFTSVGVWAVAIVAIIAAAGVGRAFGGDDYLPSGAAPQIVSVSPQSAAKAQVIVLTVPFPSTDPSAKEIAAFGELFAYSPRTIFVRRNEPTLFSFWNLQANQEHDFMLVGPHGKVLAHVDLPQLKKTKITLDFHQAGLFTFYCTMHQPYMTGQILVLDGSGGQKNVPAKAKNALPPAPRLSR